MKKLAAMPYMALLLFILLVACKGPEVPVSDSLPRSTPEAEGVSSQGILDFLDAVASSTHEFHSIMILRHGSVIAEGWWAPYRSDLKHTLYSTSKSFTAAAIGFAVSENLLSVTDKVVSFFPEYLPDSVSPFLADMTVKDLLTMTAGQDPDPSFTTAVKDSNWVEAFLHIPVLNDPGTKFLYNSLATYMLSAIVQQVTGQKLIDYLSPRLFGPLGIKGMDWEVDPRGINTGGWGLRLKTEDMAKFGQLYLQQGKWNNKEILPASWVKEATTAWIDQAPDAPESKKDSSDWMQGYCYQMWRCRNNAYRGDGAYGQYIIVMPDQDAVVAITSETSDMQDQINLVWEHLLPAMKQDKLPADATLESELKERLSSLALPLPDKGSPSSLESLISGRTFIMEPNDRGLENLRISFMEGMCHVALGSEGESHNLTLGHGKWMEGETTRRGPNLVRQARGHFNGLPPVRVAGSFGWKDENTLEMVLRYIESPHTEKFVCRFDKDKIQINIGYSQVPGSDQPVISGKMAEN
jgi:hypothetical protein